MAFDYIHDSGEGIHFTSDTHFGHRNIIKYCRRPYKNVHEMNEAMVINWNCVVKPGDRVYHLGDLAFCDEQEDTINCLKRLNGDIYMVEGNHEKSAWNLYTSPLRYKLPIKEINRYLEIEVEGQTVCLFHYAQREWHHNLKGAWHLFGHTHAHLASYGKSFDVGVDAWNYAPVSFAAVKAKMDTLAIANHVKFNGYKSQDNQGE